MIIDTDAACEADDPFAIVLAINPGCGKFVETQAPLVLEDTSSAINEDNLVIRVYTSVDSRYNLGDYFSKLKLNYGEKVHEDSPDPSPKDCYGMETSLFFRGIQQGMFAL